LDYFASELKALRGNPDTLLPCLLNWLGKDADGRRLAIWPGGLGGSGRYFFGCLYELFSDFGRSMILPLVWWALALVGFAWLYQREHASAAGRFANVCLAGPGGSWSAALGLSIRKALPFAGVASADKLDQIYACLYGIQGESPTSGDLPDRFTLVIPDAVDYIGIGQLLLSLVLIFLFLLAVRNHFRIR
jgi:hypothetical protein